MEQAIAEAELTERTMKKNRKDKRKEWKKEKRRQERRERADKEREKMEDPEEQRRAQEMEEEEKERIERERKEFEERERKWMEENAIKRKLQEQEEETEKEKYSRFSEDDDDWEYIEEGPAEIIWQGNEIIVRKKKVKVPKKNSIIAQLTWKEDKAHCPFHLKTGACRFGQRCSRVHFYPDKACTLLIKNMYNGPGLAWEQDEGLEYTDDEVDRCYEEFYEDVHTEFLKYGEIVNFKACKNGSFHLRGNVYIHYKSLDSAVLAYHSINGRYFAGKQITCEFINLTRWKVAICGEYMRSIFKTCSRGTACNFIHCFRNPGGDYELADWDKAPPKYWVEKMSALFGYSDEPVYEKQGEQDELGRLRASGKRVATDTYRYHARSRSRDSFYGSSRSKGEEGSIRRLRDKRNDRKRTKNFDEKEDSKDENYRKGRTHDNSDECQSDEDRERDLETYRRDGRPSRRSMHHTEMPDCSTNYDGARKNSIKDVEIEIDSNEELSDGPCDLTKNLRKWVKAGIPDDNKDKDKEMRHSDLRISSRHRYKISSPNDLRDMKDGTSGTGSSAALHCREREVDRRRHRRQSTRHWKDISESPDHQDDDRYRAHGYDSSDDQFERDKERRGHGRKLSSDSRHKFSDERLSAKRSRGNHDSSSPETGMSQLKGRQRGSRERGEAHFPPSLERSELHDYNNVNRYHKKQESDYTNSIEVDVQDRWKP